DMRKSINDDIALPNASVALTDGGASGDAAGIFDDEPMCMATTVAVSAQAAKNGSQWPLWMVGRPRWYGSSLKHTACTPRAALRWTSATAASTSQSGMMPSGMRRPPESPHHSSTIQSLYAFTQASPSSSSLP